MLLALLAQIPLVAAQWPLHPGTLELGAGIAGVVTGIGLNVWAERLFRFDAAGVCPFSPVAVLVERGPFRLSRNPMYLGLITIILGVVLATGVLANIWSAVAYAIWVHHAYVLPEEAFLRERFGSTFEDYCARVPRWAIFK